MIIENRESKGVRGIERPLQILKQVQDDRIYFRNVFNDIRFLGSIPPKAHVNCTAVRNNHEVVRNNSAGVRDNPEGIRICRAAALLILSDSRLSASRISILSFNCIIAHICNIRMSTNL
ncbi:MAG: hypothetical protein PWQ27_1147 [Kosmotoga sp.]|nr:hypothetical protein [Kosmotoga sp.]